MRDRAQFLTLMLLAAGCPNPGPRPDLAPLVDQAPRLDLTPPVDLALQQDLTSPPDLAPSPKVDLTCDVTLQQSGNGVIAGFQARALPCAGCTRSTPAVLNITLLAPGRPSDTSSLSFPGLDPGWASASYTKGASAPVSPPPKPGDKLRFTALCGISAAGSDEVSPANNSVTRSLTITYQ